MAGLGILRKLLEKRQDKVPLNIGKGITPDEVELNSYKEEERRDKIREELAYYRKKKNNEMLVGNTYAKMAKKLYGNQQLLSQKNLLRGKNCFNHSGKRLM